MADKDVNLVIKAKNDATRAIDSVADALKTLSGIQDDVAKSAAKTDDVLGQLGQELSNLNSQAKGLSALSTIALQLDKAGDAVKRLEAEVGKTTAEFDSLGKSAAEAQQTTARLSSDVERQTKALVAQKAATDAAKAAQTAANKELRAAETVLGRLEKRVATAKKPSDALVAKVSDQRQVVENLRAAQQAAVSNYEAQRSAQDAASKSLRTLNGDIKTAEANEKKIAKAAADAADTLSRQSEGLQRAQVGLGEISAVASRASSALGGVAVSQNSISDASKRAAEEIAKVSAALDKQKGTAAPGAAKTTVTTAVQAPERTVAGYKAQVAAVREAQAAWKDAVAEANRLATAIKNTEQPTQEQARAFLLAQAASKQAKAEYLAQGAALGQLRGVANSSFTAFSQAATKMAQAGAESSAAAANVAQSAAKASSAQRQIAPAADAAGSSMRNAAGGANGFRSALEGVSGESRKAMSLLQRVRGEVLSLTAGYLGLQAAVGQIASVINSFQTLEAAQNRLGAVFNQDTSRVDKELTFLREQADRLGISFGVLSNEYGKFAVAANEANFSSDATRKIFISVAEAARVNKLSVAETSGVFLALTQMISKGKVNAQELRQQMGERLPGAFNIFADAIGVTTAKLDKMMEQGQILANEDNLLKFADQLTERFGPQLGASLDSASTQIGRLQNNIFNAQLDVAKGGFIASLNVALKELNDFFQSDDGTRFFEGLGAALGRFTIVLAQVPKYFDEIRLAVAAFIAVKIGGVLSDIAGRFVATTGAVKAYSQELSFIGPRMQQMSLAQRVLGQGFAQTVGQIDRFRGALSTSTSATSIARAGVLGLNATLGVVRGTMIGVASVARGLWAAIGGLPGLILTGITFAVGSWLTSIDTASKDLEEHRRIVDKVIAAYDEAKGKAKDWRKEIEEGSTVQIKIKLSDAQSELDRLRKSVEAPADVFAVDKTGTVAKLRDLVLAFNKGEMSAVDFKTAVNALAEADPKLNSGIAKSMLDTADTTVKAEKQVQDYQDVLTALTGTSDEAEAAIKRLRGGVDDSGEAAKTAVFSLETYNDAIDKLKDNIPALAEVMKRLKDAAEIDSAGLTAFAEAIKSGDVAKITESLNLYAKARQAIEDAQSSKMLDALPGNKSVIDRIVNVESGGNPFAKASTSSAVGVGQFTESTWLGLFNKVFPELSELNDTAKLALRTNEEASRKMLEALTKQNQQALINAGLDANATNTYLAHFLGSGDAIKVLLANPDELAANIVKKQSVDANPSVFKPGMTARDLVQFANQKMGGGSPILTGGQTAQEQFDATIQQRVEGYKEEAAARKESNREGEIAKAIHQAEVEAAKIGATLTKEQTAAIREATGARYDALHAGEAEKQQRQEEQEAIQNLIGLDQQRKTALKELQSAMAEGDQGRVAELKDQITELNAEIAKGVPLAMQLAQALGDEKGVASLQKVTLNAKLLNVELTNAKQINGMLADGLTNAFSTAAQGIGQAIVGAKSWKDALLGVRNAFLQFAGDFLIQIGQMILKQLILNALSGAFGGATGGIGGAIAGAVNAMVKHRGGLVATSGGPSRMVSPIIFRNAARYHDGGVAGLKPGEVPAILEQGERVRTAAQEQDLQKQLSDAQTGKGKKAGDTVQSIRNVLVMNPADLAAAMASPAGEKVMVSFLKNNAATVRKILG